MKRGRRFIVPEPSTTSWWLSSSGWLPASELADALDKAIGGASDDKPEPIFLGTAGKIAEHLHLRLMEWLEANRTLVIDVPIKLGLFGAGVAFLHSIGADSATAIGSLAWLLRAPQNQVRPAGRHKPPSLAVAAKKT